MEIKVGTFYKTSSGLKARIYAVDGSPDRPIHGAIFVADRWEHLSWRQDGVCYGNSFDGYDLLNEWTEPKPKLKAYRNKLSGLICLCEGDVTSSPEYHERVPHLDEP